MPKYALSIKAPDLESLAGDISKLSGDAIGKAVVATLNESVDNAYDFARKRVTNGVNLRDSYVRRKMSVQHATAQKPEASITAQGTGTPLSEYGRVQKERQVNWTNQKILSMGKKFGKWPGWTQRRGNAGIGIEADRKADGQSVNVTGQRVGFQHAFSLAGKRDGDGNLLMFSRNPGTSKLRVLYGPAVYQLFKYQLAEGQFLEETRDLLAVNLEEAIDKELQRIDFK